MPTLDSILADADIVTLFQPILDGHNQTILGHEALSRGPEHSPYHSAAALFSLAKACQRTIELEHLCLTQAIHHFMAQQLEGRLFVNLSATALLALDIKQLISLLRSHDLPCERLVIELTEQYQNDVDGLRDVATTLREAGISLALDDLGAAFSGLRRWLDLTPDFIKLDRYFIQSLHEDPIRRLFVGSLLELANQLNTVFIVEGVETTHGWHVLQQLGIRYYQGYLLGRPQAVPAPIFWPSQHTTNPGHEQQTPMRELVHPMPTLTPEQPCQEVFELFHQDEQLHCLPVITSQGKAIGMIRRNRLLAHFAERFGHSLYAKRPVRSLMDHRPIQVDAGLDVLQVSQHLIEHNSDEMDAWFIICEEGRYLGMGSVRELMRRLTHYQLQMAQHANPLTLLPGNVPIQQALERAIAMQERFHLAYCDLNFFKPYNDVYGYDRGDQLITLVANLLRKHLGQRHNFIGHLGGDDFILLLRHSGWEQHIVAMQAELRQMRQHYYRDEDWLAGGIQSLDRDGQPRFFPLLELAIGLVSWQPGCGFTATQLSEQLTQAKKEAKQLSGEDYWLATGGRVAC